MKAIITVRQDTMGRPIYFVGVEGNGKRVERFLLNHWYSRRTAEQHRRTLQADLNDGLVKA